MLPHVQSFETTYCEQPARFGRKYYDSIREGLKEDQCLHNQLLDYLQTTAYPQEHSPAELERLVYKFVEQTIRECFTQTCEGLEDQPAVYITDWEQVKQTLFSKIQHMPARGSRLLRARLKDDYIRAQLEKMDPHSQKNDHGAPKSSGFEGRSEEHTSELQSSGESRMPSSA